MSRARPPSAVLVALLALLPLGTSRAADAPAATGSALALRTERAVVFKDGYALFVRAGKAVADDRGRVHTDRVPAGAVLGCFWASAEGRPVRALRAGWEERREVRERAEPCLGVLDVLRANVGRAVVLGLAREGAPDVQGRVVGVLEAPAPAPPPPPTPPVPRGPEGTEVVPAATVGGSHVVVDQGATRTVLPVAEVRTVTGADLVLSTTRREDVVTRSKRLTVELGPDAAGQEVSVRLLHFAEGLRWIPTYRVEGAIETDAEVSLQAELVNEAEDLEDAAVDLVVGVPTFRFRDVLSPLTLETAVARALGPREQRARALVAQSLSNAFFSNDEGDVAAEAAAGGGLVVPPDLVSEGQADLFVHRLGRASLRRGERAAFALWQARSPLRHLHTLDVLVVRDHRSGEHRYRSAKQDAGLEPAAGGTAVGASGGAPVWHELELSNGTDVPWTTGAALVVKGDVPLAQGLLAYTSAGARTLLPLTVAVDVRGTWEEVETARTPNAIRWNNATFGQIRKHGTVTLVNRRREPTATRVSVSLGGRAEAATDGGKVTLNDVRAADWSSGSSAVNNHSDVVWEVTLAPGETRRLEVDFTFYVP